MKWDRLRKRAETILDSRCLPHDEWSETDFLHLVQELEVHQVELELQGDELRQKNRELQELLHRYSDLYNHAPIGFVSLNVQGVVVEANFAAGKILGIPREQMKHRGFSRFIFHEDQEHYFQFIKDLFKLPDRKGRGDLRLLRKQDDPFYVHMEVAPLKNERGLPNGYLVAFMDISGSKQAEQDLQDANGQLEESRGQLKNLSARLISVLEEERKRIARELHDSVSQTLSAMKFSIENALKSRHLVDPEEAFTILDRLVPIVQGAIDEVRNIYTGLRPSVLDDLGIVTAITWFCREFRAAFPSLHIEVAATVDEAEVPEDLKIVIFRIIQEALNNAAKHSGAEWVDISLARTGNRIDLMVDDNGRGFDPEAVAQRKNSRSMGLASMRERAELSGGSLAIESVKGQGTCIHAIWEL